ncbi:hypothetical protein F7P69_20705 [Cellulosimicrobium funkei]|nr:hypothetical protein [Cellulosimicrobium funkei]
MDSREPAPPPIHPLPIHPVSHTGPGALTAWGIPLMLSSADRPEMDWGHQLHRSAATGTSIRLRPGAFVKATSWNSAFARERHLATALSIAMTSKRPPVFARETALMLHRLPLNGIPSVVKLRASSVGAAGTTRRLQPEASKPPLFSERRLVYPKSWADSTHAERPAVSLLIDGEVALRAEDLHLTLADALPHMTPGSAIMVADAVLSGRRLADGGQHPRMATPMGSEEFLGLADLCLTKKSTAAFRQIAQFASPLSESPGESLSRLSIEQLGFQTPELQHRIYDAQGQLLGIVDFWWEELQLAGEFDGKKKYTGGASYSGRSIEDVIREEKQRMERMQEEGIRFVRWMWSDLASVQRLAGKLIRAGVPRIPDEHRPFNHSLQAQP